MDGLDPGLMGVADMLGLKRTPFTSDGILDRLADRNRCRRGFRRSGKCDRDLKEGMDTA